MRGRAGGLGLRGWGRSRFSARSFRRSTLAATAAAQRAILQAVLVGLLCLGTLGVGSLSPAWAQASEPAQDLTIAQGRLRVVFKPQTRTLEVVDSQAGPLLERGMVQATVDKQVMSSERPGGLQAWAGPEAWVDPKQRLRLPLGEGAWAVIRLLDEEQVEVATEGLPDGPAVFQATAAMGPRAVLGLLSDKRIEDRKVLLMTYGHASVASARSLFDPLRDMALTAGALSRVRWWHRDAWRLYAEAPRNQVLVMFKIERQYYRRGQAISQYAPRPLQKRWPSAPSVAMSWYGIEAWNGQPAQRLERLAPNIDWVAEHWAPYVGKNLVFQIDDNYAAQDDRAMREIADYIRSKGLVPGIWLAPYAAAPQAAYRQHPEWFLMDRNGKLLTCFAGVNCDWSEDPALATAGALNATNPQAAEQMWTPFWRKVSQEWKFDYFKIDGQPSAARAYRTAINGKGVEGYRQGLQLARNVVGEERFLHGCGGPSLDSLGLVNGARTGPDTGKVPHAAPVIIRWNFLNNICQWCDPDAAANLRRATVQRARLNAQARALTGQQFVTDDVWTEVPPEIRRIWQLASPSLDIQPANLYKIDDWQLYDLFDLRIGKPWDAWDVVGVFNFGGSPTEKIVELSRLPLEAEEVHIYDFWNRRYLGKFSRTAKLLRRLKAFEGQVYCLRAHVPDRPVLLSTSRHISQGGLVLDQLTWKQEGERWIASGTSSHLVAGDRYELVFVPDRFEITKVETSVPHRVLVGGGLARAELTPAESGTLKWRVVFAPVTDSRLGVSRQAIDLRQGGATRFEVRSLGTREVEFKIESSDRRVRVFPSEGKLAPWPARVAVLVSSDFANLEPSEELPVRIVVRGLRPSQPPEEVAVRLYALPRENLVQQAKASASSFRAPRHWTDKYEPQLAIDGNADTTRWQSAEDDIAGSWIELSWAGPVSFDRVEIDECATAREQVQQWRLEAGTDSLETISHGTKLGRDSIVKLPKLIEARRLRLVVEKATAPPSIWEIKVYRAP